MREGRLLAVLLLGAVGLGCAGTPSGPQPQRDHSTRITEGGLKFFVYTWQWPDDASFGVVDTQVATRTTGTGFVRGHFYDREDEFLEEIREWVKATGYCREGYFELSRYYDVAGARFRGECKDLANEADRRRFGPQGQRPATRPKTSSAG